MYTWTSRSRQTGTRQWRRPKPYFGSLSILVNNAGIVTFGRIDEYPQEQWARIIDVNLTGVFNGIKAAAPALTRAGGGAIINVSSIAGLRGYEQLSGYTASKYGVRGLTKSAALDLGSSGIRVNSVHPGVIETPMTAGMTFDTGHVPLHRTGQPPEIAALAVYLAADESSFVTGAEFVIDGGETAGTVAPPARLSNGSNPCPRILDPNSRSLAPAALARPSPTPH